MQITDEMINAAIMAYIQSGKKQGDMYEAMRAALEAALRDIKEGQK